MKPDVELVVADPRLWGFSVVTKDRGVVKFIGPDGELGDGEPVVIGPKKPSPANMMINKRTGR